MILHSLTCKRNQQENVIPKFFAQEREKLIHYQHMRLHVNFGYHLVGICWVQRRGKKYKINQITAWKSHAVTANYKLTLWTINNWRNGCNTWFDELEHEAIDAKIKTVEARTRNSVESWTFSTPLFVCLLFIDCVNYCHSASSRCE